MPRMAASTRIDAIPNAAWRIVKLPDSCQAGWQREQDRASGSGVPAQIRQWLGMPGLVLYHGTAAESVKSIRETGLFPLEPHAVRQGSGWLSRCQLRAYARWRRGIHQILRRAYARVTASLRTLGGTASYGLLGPRCPAMPTSLSVPADGAIPELVKPDVRPMRGPPAAMTGDRATITLHLVRDRDRIARDMNDIVVHRLFSAGLALQSALGLLGDHPGAGKVHDAISELDLALRDIRNVVFDHDRRSYAPGPEQPG